MCLHYTAIFHMQMYIILSLPNLEKAPHSFRFHRLDFHCERKFLFLLSLGLDFFFRCIYVFLRPFAGESAALDTMIVMRIREMHPFLSSN